MTIIHLNKGFWNSLKANHIGAAREYLNCIIRAIDFQDIKNKLPFTGEDVELIEEKYDDKIFEIINKNTGNTQIALPDDSLLDLTTVMIYDKKRMLKPSLIADTANFMNNQEKGQDMTLANNTKDLVDAIYGELKRCDFKSKQVIDTTPALFARLKDLYEFKEQQEKEEKKLDTRFIYRLLDIMLEFNEALKEHQAHETHYNYTKDIEDIEEECIDKLIREFPEFDELQVRFDWRSNWTNYCLKEFLMSTENENNRNYSDDSYKHD